MKLLFLYPKTYYYEIPNDFDYFRYTLCNFPPVTFYQLASVLPPDVEVEIEDCFAQDMPSDEYCQKLASFDVICMSLPSSKFSLNCHITVKLIKKINPSAKIILGGHHSTYFAERWLRNDVDFVVRHEGELTFAQLIQALKNNSDYTGIKGLGYCKDGEPVFTELPDLIEDLDTLPLPRYDLVKQDYYRTFLNTGPSAVIESTRGCKNCCSFCATPQMWHRTVRQKSIPRVIQEMNLIKELGFTEFFLADESFGETDRDRELTDNLSKNPILPFGTFMRFDVIFKNREFMKKAAKGGLRYVMVGYEIADNEILERMNKSYDRKYSMDDYIEIRNFLHSIGIYTIGFFLVGYPDETIEQRKGIFKYWTTVCDFPLPIMYMPFPETKPSAKTYQVDNTFYAEANILRLIYFSEMFNEKGEPDNNFIEMKYSKLQDFISYIRQDKLIRNVGLRRYMFMFEQLFTLLTSPSKLAELYMLYKSPLTVEEKWIKLRDKYVSDSFINSILRKL